MYVEYDSVRVFFFLPPAAFLGALADFLEGVLAILMICVWFAKLREADSRLSSCISGAQRAGDLFVRPIGGPDFGRLRSS